MTDPKHTEFLETVISQPESPEKTPQEAVKSVAKEELSPNMGWERRYQLEYSRKLEHQCGTTCYG